MFNFNKITIIIDELNKIERMIDKIAINTRPKRGIN